MIQKSWISAATTRYEENHTEFIGFSEAVEAFYMQRSDWSESMTKMNSPLPVQMVIHKNFNIALLDDNTFMACILLKAADKITLYGKIKTASR